MVFKKSDKKDEKDKPKDKGKDKGKDEKPGFAFWLKKPAKKKKK